MLNEADTRAQLIDPKLEKSGWTRTKIKREHYYRPDWEYTAGRIVLRGDKTERLPPKRVDYLLRYMDSFPMAVVEAKEEGKAAISGLTQVIEYAKDLNLAFAYTTNGHDIIEWDGFTGETQTIETFPTPEELWQRWQLNTGLSDPPELVKGSKGELRLGYNPQAAEIKRRNPLLYPYASQDATRGKEPRYFQEAAIKEVILRVMRGQKHILLTMATGTGKTFTAFQIVWKLIKSGWLRHKKEGGIGRVLFLADRTVLRDQAYNAFSAFATTASDPRFLVDGKQTLTLNRDLYFAIYQSLWAEEKGKRVFEQFPKDFFDLIIIDEAHRSGFGTWREILDHFSTAIHFGMTATPKQDESIDTYGYFCAEETPQAVDESSPDKGVFQPPAYSYSLGQGIEDGFLATYKVHYIRTTVDRDGLNIQEVLEQGAEVFVPQGVEVRDEYKTGQFEREITVPDRTKMMVDHLSILLRRFGVMHRTMVFCVDMDHAQEVARQLNNNFSDLGYGDDYAVAIVSEEGEAGKRRLQQFQDSDKQLPVIATTAELLSTGVDVPSARNVVFMKTLASPILFKQIIGRGTRVDSDTGKYWFRIIDYTGATRLLDPKWDKPPLPSITEEDLGPQTATLQGTARLEGSKEILVGATISVLVSPNDQRGPILTDDKGKYRFESLPAKKLTLMAGGSGMQPMQVQVETQADGITIKDIYLKPSEKKKREKIKVKGLEVEIADEATFIVEGMSEPMSLQEYLDYSKEKIVSLVPNWEDLKTAWQNAETRKGLMEQLTRKSIYIGVIAEVLNETNADDFDLIAHLVYKQPIRTRFERASTFRQRENAWLNTHSQPSREVILALLQKYELGGVEELSNPAIFRVPPFREMGELRGVVKRFNGDANALRAALSDLERKLYDS